MKAFRENFRQDFFLHVLGLTALVIGAAFRFYELDRPPLHADEATGARITASVLETGRLQFDPFHFHGPLLHGLGAVSSLLNGKSGWRDLEISPLLRVSAVAGLLTCLIPLALMPWMCRTAAIFGSAFVALNPWLIYYGRVFIHETLLLASLSAVLFLLIFWWNQRSFFYSIAIGFLLGFSAATKETWILTPTAWATAGVTLGFKWQFKSRKIFRHLLLMAVAFLICLSFFYSDFGRNPVGVLDFIQSYRSYKVSPGHEKHFAYYIELLILPISYGHYFWWPGAVICLAFFGCFGKKSRERDAVRFLCLSAGVHLVVYSFISYKTPWLMLVTIAHFTVAAGLSVGHICGSPLRLKGSGVLLLAAALLVFEVYQAHLLVFKLGIHPRNPLAYVSTAPSVAKWTEQTIRWLLKVGATDETVAVIGPGYWPLRWYLRPLKNVGY